MNLGIIFCLILLIFLIVVIYLATRTTVTCKDNQKITDNKCLNCDPFMVATKDKKNCEVQSCPIPDRMIVLPDGSCRACDDYKKPIQDASNPG